MEAFTRDTTRGMQVTVFDSYEARQALKGRGYKFGDLPRPVQSPSGWRYGRVEPGWYKWPIDAGEIAFLESLNNMPIRHIIQDQNGAIAEMQDITKMVTGM